MSIRRFNIRVYAIIFNGDDVLLADESINDFAFTKFPGGGVELGEGIMDALKRELMEEGEIELKSAEHFYTTDFLQVSAFKPDEQIVSVYYKVNADVNWKSKASDQSIPGKKHLLNLYFLPLEKVMVDDLTFPIDQHVLKLLKSSNE
jgi:ADP-ribose pyrophosphatase YjhB (NUDIX family)